MISAHKKKLMALVIAVILVGFTALSLFVVADPVDMLDENFSHKIQSYQSPSLDIVMKLISWFGYFPGSIIMVALAAIVFLIFKYKREALFMLFTAVSGLVSTILKIIVNRPRPTEKVVHIFRKATEQSFPSGHTLFYVVYFGFLSLLMMQLKSIPMLIRVVVFCCSVFLIFTIPFSRIYLGAHWFTDVVGGALVGIILLTILSYFYENRLSKG